MNPSDGLWVEPEERFRGPKPDFTQLVVQVKYGMFRKDEIKVINMQAGLNYRGELVAQKREYPSPAIKVGEWGEGERGFLQLGGRPDDAEVLGQTRPLFAAGVLARSARPNIDTAYFDTVGARPRTEDETLSVTTSLPAPITRASVGPLPDAPQADLLRDRLITAAADALWNKTSRQTWVMEEAYVDTDPLVLSTVRTAPAPWGAWWVVKRVRHLGGRALMRRLHIWLPLGKDVHFVPICNRLDAETRLIETAHETVGCFLYIVSTREVWHCINGTRAVYLEGVEPYGPLVVTERNRHRAAAAFAVYADRERKLRWVLARRRIMPGDVVRTQRDLPAGTTLSAYCNRTRRQEVG